jgi:small-conductance mechanosensitive channel
MNDIIALFYAGNFLRIFILIVGGIPLVYWMSRLLATLCAKHFSQHVAVITRKIILYSGLLCLLIAILQEFGFNVVTLLGAAGIFGIAIGFASQTAISNIISGFFYCLNVHFLLVI